jgi:hypothetical protein
MMIGKEKRCEKRVGGETYSLFRHQKYMEKRVKVERFGI